MTAAKKARVASISICLVAAMLGFPVAHGQSEAWIEVPAPELEGLEPTVAEQLDGLRELVEGLAADSEVPGPELGEAFGELAQHYHAYDLAGVAEESYRIAGRLAPADFRWPYLLAYLLQTGGRLEEAVALYERALGLDPKVPPAFIRLGHTYMGLNRAEEARRALERALELDPTSAAAEAAMGQLLLSERRYEEAVERLERALEQQPEANRLYYPLALAYRGLEDLERAQQLMALRGEVGIRPGDPLVDGLAGLTTGERSHLLRGRAAFDAGHYDVAVGEFTQALEADPESVRARINLASALAQEDRAEEAIGHLQRVVELAPGNSTAHFNLAQLYRASGDRELALEHLQDAALYAPRDAEIQLQLADAFRAAGDLEKALVSYGKAVAADPASEFGRLGEADVLTRLGRFEEAVNRLETAHGMMPQSGAVAHGLARLLAGCPRPELRDGERAVALAQSVFQARPTVRHLKTLAMAYAETGQCEIAARWMEKGLETAQKAGAEEGVGELLTLHERYSSGPPCRPPVQNEPSG